MGYQSDAVVAEEGRNPMTVVGRGREAVLEVRPVSRLFFEGIGRWCEGRVAAWTSADVDGLLSSKEQQRMHQLPPELPFQTALGYGVAANC